MHMTPRELWSRLREIKEMQPGSARRIQAHRALAEQCPAFVPNLLSLHRTLLLDRREGDAQAHFTEGERALRDAVELSEEDAAAPLELAHFLDVVRDAPGEAEPLFAEAARRASKSLEEAWAGWIGVLGQQEKFDAALELAEQAQRVFPHSETIAEAIATAGLGRELTR